MSERERERVRETEREGESVRVEAGERSPPSAAATHFSLKALMFSGQNSWHHDWASLSANAVNGRKDLHVLIAGDAP